MKRFHAGYFYISGELLRVRIAMIITLEVGRVCGDFIDQLFSQNKRSAVIFHENRIEFSTDAVDLQCADIHGGRIQW